MTISEFDFIAILVATVGGFLVGAVWFLPKLFGSMWAQDVGKDMDNLGNPAKAMSITFVTTFITTLVLYVILQAFNVTTVVDAALISIMVSAGVLATSTLSDYLFCDWPVRLWLIQAGHRVVSITLIGIILGLF